MARRTDYLFAEGDLGASLTAASEQIPGKIDQVPKDQFLASSEEELVNHFVSTLAVEPLELHEDRMYLEQSETQVDVAGSPDRDWGFPGRSGPLLVPGTEAKISIPFNGDIELWKLRPSTYRTTFPFGNASGPRTEKTGTLVLTLTKPHDKPQEEFKSDVDRLLDDIRFYVDNQRRDIETFNRDLPNQIRAAVSARRERLRKQEGLSEMLGIPLKPREGTAPIEPIRMKEKIVKPLPPPPKSGLKSEPGIDEKNYENILKIIRHQGRAFETTPSTYKVHDEEELRDMIVANLNIYLEGEAGGETFRKSGKTDICVKEGDRAAFVAECAMWRGEKHLVGKVDQLLGYLTWRDCKAALVIFNKEVAGFAELLNKVPETLAKHRFLVKDIGQQGEGEWRYVLRSAEDEGRRITVHVFMFNLFVK